MAAKVIAIASDRAGIETKDALKDDIAAAGLRVIDLGTHGPDSVDYPDLADALTEEIRAGRVERGILVCGTGIGMSIAANRKPFIRAALCHSATEARLAREHNNANVLVVGARTMGIETVRDCLKAFLETAFEVGRHQRRIDKMS